MKRSRSPSSCYLADLYGLRPWPFLLGVVFAVAGLLLSWSLVQDTAPFVAVESRRHPPTENPPLLRPSFLAATAGNRQLFACNQAGLVNNLNDGVAWGRRSSVLGAARTLDIGAGVADPDFIDE